MVQNAFGPLGGVRTSTMESSPIHDPYITLARTNPIQSRSEFSQCPLQNNSILVGGITILATETWREGATRTLIEGEKLTRETYWRFEMKSAYLVFSS